MRGPRIFLIAAILLLAPFHAFAGPACPEGDFGRFYNDAAPFAAAIADAEAYPASTDRLSGIVVPHHLLADHLMALGFQAASGFAYKRIIVLSPDHFRQTDQMFATTTRGFDTVLGPVATDTDAVGTLMKSDVNVEDSCLFAREHGVLALLPFIAKKFPGTKIVPVAMSIRSKREDWDRLAAALEPLVDADTLIVESTDFSHYLPQHEARRFDQQTMNVLVSGSLDAIAALLQPQHADSVGALYVQAKLQKKLFGATPQIIANENSQQYSTRFTNETTSYQVILFGPQDTAYPPVDDVQTYYFAGDVNFGRAMKTALLDADAADQIAADILARTKGQPLIVNLEGVILPNVPDAIDNMTLAMPEDLTIAWLKRLNVAAVGLANNHAMDLGPTGYAETTRALDSAGISWFGQGDAVQLPGLDIVGLADIDSNGSRQTDLITPELLDRLVRQGSDRPVVAYIHWGREYIDRPSRREVLLADQMRQRSVAAIIGAHPHVASEGLDALAGGDAVQAYSLGNFLFDQSADRASGAMMELKVFSQGTVAARLMPLPNYFDMAKR